MDLILRNGRIAGQPADRPPVDIGIEGGRIVAIETALAAEGETLDLGGRLISPGLIETHIHLDKSRIIDRCTPDVGRQSNRMMRVSEVKHTFTVEDVYERARQTLERCLVNGATHMRTHVELDPKVALRSFEAIEQLAKDYRWAIDIEICVFPQEGLTDNPGTDELLVEGLKRGARLIGGAPNYDSDHAGQIRRIFELAREFDVDVDIHLDSGHTTHDMDVWLVCEMTEKFGWGGRVTIGHGCKYASLPPDELRILGRRLADAGVAVTVLPATDLFIAGRHLDHDVIRGVADANALIACGVNCSLSTNNVLNPFTPFGDASLIRIANLYANIVQRGLREELDECFEMLTRRSARILRRDDYGVAIGNPADLVVFDATSPAQAVAEVAQPMYGFKRGRRTFTRPLPALHRPA